MRVLITSSIYPTPGAPKIVGGAEVFVRRLAENLVQAGVGVEVIRAASRRDQPMESCNGVDIYSAPIQNIYFPFSGHRSAPIRGVWHVLEDWQKTAHLVTKRIEAFKPHILHSNNLSGLTTGVWKAASDLTVPVLHTLHDYYLTCPRCSRFSNGKACVHTCMNCKLLTMNRRKATQYLSAIVGVSQRIIDIHTGLGLFLDTPLRKVIHNGPTLETGVPETRSVEGPLRLGFIGRLAEEKGIFNLVQAVAAIPPGRVRLIVAGHASESDLRRVKALAPNADIEYLGFVAPADFYEKVDVVAVPSIWEDPGPLVVADARAVGKPLLGTHFGGISEAIEQDVTGWLSAPDPKSLTKTILQIISDPQKVAEISHRLKKDFKRRTFADVVNEYRDMYQQIHQPGEYSHRNL